MPQGMLAILRYDLVFKLLGNDDIGRFLEIGPGYGDFLLSLAKRGFSGAAVDTSEASIALIRERLDACGVEDVCVECGDVSDVDGSFETAFMFEVLEHIDDPVAFLEKVRATLAPGGRLVLSVPAHPRLWDATDEVAGHVQRFERAQLVAALQSAGFEDVRVLSLGVPFANAAKPLLSALNARRMRRSRSITEATRVERTASSGLARALPLSDTGYRLAFNRVTMAPALFMQRLFASSDLGVDYVAVASRP